MEYTEPPYSSSSYDPYADKPSPVGTILFIVLGGLAAFLTYTWVNYNRTFRDMPAPTIKKKGTKKARREKAMEGVDMPSIYGE